MITSPSHIFLSSTWKMKEMTKLHVIAGSDDGAARHCNFNVVAGCKELKRMCIQKHFPGGTSGKEPTCQCRRHRRCEFNSWIGKIPWKRKWQPTPVFLPRKFHGQRSLASDSPWGCKESDATEWLSMHTQLEVYITSIHILWVQR